MALVLQRSHDKQSKRRALLITLGLFGAALLYGDGIITPAISVLSAVEGLNVATDVFEPYVVPITIVIILVLFLVQRHGTARVGAVFGPFMIVWFFVIAGARGARASCTTRRCSPRSSRTTRSTFFVDEPRPRLPRPRLGVPRASPAARRSTRTWATSAKKPIRLAWFALVLPALLLNYFGPGRAAARDPGRGREPVLSPRADWALRSRSSGLATVATVIASQAVISGAFSLTRQAMQLGYCPRMEIVHTSARGDRPDLHPAPSTGRC